MRIAELFAGVGGFRIGFERFNKDAFETVFFNQWEPSKKKQFAYDCYVYNFGLESVPEYARQYTNLDIREVPKNEIPDFDLLVGGFPCQDYSVAHSLSSSRGIEGEKGELWWDIRSTLEAKNPRFVLLENVDRILKSPANQRGRDFGIILKCFDELNYSVEWCVINAADFNEPQKRRRTFIFAYRNDTQYANNPVSIFEEFAPTLREKSNEADIDNLTISEISSTFKFDFRKHGTMSRGHIISQDIIVYNIENTHTLATVMEHCEYEKYYNYDKEKFVVLKGAKKLTRTTRDGYTYNFSEGACPYPDNLNVPARTMLTSEGTTNRSTHIVEDEGRYRLLMPLECERIQTFPDNWTKYGLDSEGNQYELTDRERYFLMGNALVTNLISRLAPRILHIYEEERP